MKSSKTPALWEVVAEAWDNHGELRYALARQALSLSRDCTDAYVLLAEEAYLAKDTSRVLALFEEGVRTGERELGVRFMVEEAGHFWKIHGTRAYMRARLGLANALWDIERRWEAIAHYTEMLRLNPDDNQGVRYELARCLIEENANEMLTRILNAYRWDTTTLWLYTRALSLFRGFEDCTKCSRALTRAFNANSFVPEYLLGYQDVPPELPPWVSGGSKEEAATYAGAYGEGWRRSPNALDWMHRRWSSFLRRSTRPPSR